MDAIKIAVDQDEVQVDLSITMSPDLLIRASEDILSKMGQMMTHSLKRKQSQLLCIRDGHEWHVFETGRLCKRCTLLEGELPTK